MILQELNVKIGLLIDEFQKNAARVKDEASNMENTFRQLKGALAAIGVFAFMKGAIAEFAESERAINRLQFTLKGLGYDWEAITPQIKAYADQMEKVAGFHSDDLIPQMDRLIKLTGNYKEAMALMPDVLDIVASGSMDLTTATEAVGRAFIGDQRGLGTLAVGFGIARRDAKDFGDIMQTVRSRVEGAAAAQHGMSRDLMDFDNTWKNFQQNAGGSVASLVHFGSEALKVALPIAQSLDNVRKAQDKMLAEPVDWIAKKIRSWMDTAKIAKTESEKMVDELMKAGMESRKPLQPLAGARLTQGRVSREEQAVRMKEAEDAAKGEYDINKKYGDEYLRLVQANSAKLAVLYGKSSNEYKKHKAEELKITRDVETQKMDLSEKRMNNDILAGRATAGDLLAVMQNHSAKIRELWGADSQEYLDYENSRMQATIAANEFIMTSGQAVVTSISAGFEGMFTAIAKEGADASKAVEAFARSMGRSLLNSVASAIEGKAAEGMAGYLANMLMGGPLGAAAVSAYSLPLLATMAATAGMVRGLAAMMAEGGTLTRPGLVMMAEKKSGEPETAIPLSRMDEVFTKYSQFLGKRRGMGAGGKTTIIIQRVNDNRGAIVASSNYDKGKAAKNLGQLLIDRGVLAKSR